MSSLQTLADIMAEWQPRTLQRGPNIHENLRPLLSKRLLSRNCTTMANYLSDDRSEELGGKSGFQAGRELLNSAFIRGLRRNSASQQPVAELVDLANAVADAPRPLTPGKMLVRRVEMMGPGTRKVRKRDRGKAGKGAGRGKTVRELGNSKTSFVTLDPEDEIIVSSSWDLKQMEDADWDIGMDEVRSVSIAHEEECSQVVIDKLKNITAGDTAGGSNYSGTANAFSFDDLVEMKASMTGVNAPPNAMIMHPFVAPSLMTDDAFTDSFRYGDMVNKSEGYLGRVFGMDVYETTQMPLQHLYMLNTNEVLTMGIRRDGLMKAFEESKNGEETYGVKISTRYDLQELQPIFLRRCQNAGPDSL